jgi:hypothetical protein
MLGSRTSGLTAAITKRHKGHCAALPQPQMTWFRRIGVSAAVVPWSGGALEGRCWQKIFRADDDQMKILRNCAIFDVSTAKSLRLRIGPIGVLCQIRRAPEKQNLRITKEQFYDVRLH